MATCCTGERKFRYYCQRILPAVYDDALSYAELVCRISATFNSLSTELGSTGEGVEELQEKVEELEELFKEFQETGFDDYYLDQIKQWMDENMWCLMSWGSRMVWFGISEDGYFTAYVPDNLNFLAFDCILDPESEYFGYLTLSYEADVYEPCQISCWDGDCLKPDTTSLEVVSE